MKYFFGCINTIASVIFALNSHFTLAEDISSSFLKWNSKTEHSQCPGSKSFLWVSHEQGGNCIRYFSSSNLIDAEYVVVQFYGDRDMDARQPEYLIKNNTQQDQERYAQHQSEKTGIPYVVMARPGTFGSSGKHSEKRMKSESLAIQKGLVLLKNKYNIKKFILLGHSGGATLVASVLTLGQEDVKCAFLTSGTYNFFTREAVKRINNNENLNFNKLNERISMKYDPYFYVNSIVSDEKRIIYIMGDVRDINTPFQSQVSFAWRVSSFSHNVHLLKVEGYPPSFHNIKYNQVLSEVVNCSK